MICKQMPNYQRTPREKSCTKLEKYKNTPKKERRQSQLNLVRSSPLPSQRLLVLVHEGPLVLVGELVHGGEHGGDRVLGGDWSLLTAHVRAHPPRVERRHQNTLRIQLHCKISRHHVQGGLGATVGVHPCPRLRNLS